MRYSIILVGAGSMGTAWLKNILTSNYFKLSGIVEPNKVNQERVIKEFNLSPSDFFYSLGHALSKLNADGVLIATPTNLHKEQILTCWKKGLHILVEKPLVSNMKEIKELLTEYKRERILMVSQNYRWSRESRTIKEVLNSGAIGKIGYINYSFYIPARFGGWRQELKHVLLEDMSIHHFDLMRYFTNKNFSWIFAHSFRPEWSWHKGNPTTFVIGELEDNISFCYSASWISQENNTQWIGEITFTGSEGALKYDSKGRLFLYKKKKEERIPLIKQRRNSLKLVLEEFYNSIKESRQPSTDLLDNIQSFAITQACIYSSENKIKVDIPDFLREYLS